MTTERTQTQNELHQEDGDVQQIDKKHVQTEPDGSSFISQECSSSSSSSFVEENSSSNHNNVEETSSSNNKTSYLSSQEEGGSGDDRLPSASSMDHDEYEFQDPEPYIPNMNVNNGNMFYNNDEYLVAQEFADRINSHSRIDIDHILDGADALLQNVADEIRNYRDEAIGLLNHPRERYLDYVQLVRIS